MDSFVSVYSGARRSGKTMTMSIRAVNHLLMGEKVWSNYPIRFDWCDENGELTEYKSESLEIEDLITFRQDIRNGVICLDELNLWASARGHASMVNRLLNNWLQLLGHRFLSLYIAIQVVGSLDVFFRQQIDQVTECYDMHYRYRNIPKGVLIYEESTDWSGVFTGRPLYGNRWGTPEWQRNTKTMYLHTRPFWGIYNSWSEVDILKAMTQYRVEREVKVIGRDATGNAVISEDMPVEKRIKMLTDAVMNDNPGGAVLTPGDMIQQLAAFNIKGSMKRMDKYLFDAGWTPNPQTGEYYLGT